MPANKRFQNNESQEVVSIIGENDRFYNLSNGHNVAKNVFLQKFSEMYDPVDPTNFFQSQTAAGLADLAEKIKTVDSRNAVDGNIAPSVKYRQEAVSEQIAAPPEYREMMLRKAQEEMAHRDLSQYKVFENEDDAAADFERKRQQAQQAQQRPPRQREQYQEPYQEPYQQPVQQVTENVQPMAPTVQAPAFVSQEEESFRFFKGFKRVHPIKLSVDFDERIAEPNFIKLMVVNMEGDIIKYYTKEIMNRIYNDPGFLENKIYEKLRSLVFEEDQKPEPKPKAVRATKKQATPKKTTKKTTPENNG